MTLKILMISLKSHGTMKKNWKWTEKYLFKELEPVKTDDSYVEPIVQDAETIEKETKKKKKDDEFFKLALKFGEIDSAAIEQNSQENIIHLCDYLEDEKS